MTFKYIEERDATPPQMHVWCYLHSWDLSDCALPRYMEEQFEDCNGMDPETQEEKMDAVVCTSDFDPTRVSRYQWLAFALGTFNFECKNFTTDDVYDRKPAPDDKLQGLLDLMDAAYSVLYTDEAIDEILKYTSIEYANKEKP